MKVRRDTKGTDHICARHAICFQCFKAGVERTRARREAWAQRSLPFETAAPELSTREIAHRQQMLAHLAQGARRA
jgi:hypothetical protein